MSREYTLDEEGRPWWTAYRGTPFTIGSYVIHVRGNSPLYVIVKNHKNALGVERPWVILYDEKKVNWKDEGTIEPDEWIVVPEEIKDNPQAIQLHVALVGKN